MKEFKVFYVLVLLALLCGCKKHDLGWGMILTRWSVLMYISMTRSQPS